MGVHIAGWGSHLPEKIITNHDLAAVMDTSHDWIVERTGIHERRVGEPTSTMAIAAGRKALQSADVGPDEIDLLILATTSTDQVMPSTAATVQAELGLRCGAIDVNAACSGFVYALVQAAGMIELAYRRVLVIGADSLWGWTDQTDRGTAILFADGGGAVVVEGCDDDALLGFDLGCDGTTRHLLYTDHGAKITMEGREIFRRAVRAMVSSSRAALDRAGLGTEDVDWVVPHQANLRIIESAVDKLGLSLERTINVLHRTGNTSAASIPLALVEGVDSGRIQPGDILLLTGFGAGMTWASAVLRWQP
ncbi:MAG: ketoacyl-ACP synthase III [Acidimicrobiia bacterium]|nr:ketoacyl-ACP synthase III [Acidimicrobiia bacterium]